MRHLTGILFLSTVLVLGARPSVARTWYVASDGSGDAPTIAAAIDSSAVGDIILVGPGSHPILSDVGGGVVLKANTSLVSEWGPAATELFAAAGPLQPSLVGLRDNCVVTGFTLRGGQLSTVGCSGSNVEVSTNIVKGRIVITGTGNIHHNIVDEPIMTIYVASAGPIQIQNNIVLGEITSFSTMCLFDVVVTCNLIQGEHACFLAHSNFNADPLFCGPSNTHLRNDSPCAPGNHPDGIDCGLIGPLPVGCGPVRVETKTWGAVKALYSD